MSDALYVIGLMSGTSADGVDAALVRSDGQDEYEFVGADHVPYDEEFRERLLRCAQEESCFTELISLEQQLTRFHVQAVERLRGRCPNVDPVGLLGFHGHTVVHRPHEGITHQIGNPALLAQRTGISVVSDFRRLDVAEGGQGAPLAPLFHRIVCQDIDRPTAVLNLGGVGNLTYLGRDSVILSGDTGPGCGLLDDWIRRETSWSFDRDGHWASQGKVDHSIVASFLQHPFLARRFPKSADRFEFELSLDGLSVADGAATLCAVTVAGVARALEQLPEQPQHLWLTGGGSRHPLIVHMLRGHVRQVASISELGWRPDTLEAECFAWLAVRRWYGLPTSLPETTGCSRPVSGGSITAISRIE